MCGDNSVAAGTPVTGRWAPSNRISTLTTSPVWKRTSHRCSGCVPAGTKPNTPSASTPAPARCGGLRSARRRSPTVSAPRWTATGTGKSPGQASVPETGGVPPLREEGPRPRPGHLHHRRDSGGAADRRHVTLPRIGRVRVHENTRRLQRLLVTGRARILAVTVSRKGARLIAAFRVLVQRPQQSRVANPNSGVGVDVGVRVLATVANSRGEVIERVGNPRPLATALKELRHLSRRKSRRSSGSRRYVETTQKISRLHRRVADIRGHHIHALTTRLAKTHGEIVVEGLDAAGMLRQKGLTGARARRRGLSDSALGETRRQLVYKTRWYGSQLTLADRFYPSSKTCHVCGHKQEIGWAQHWTCNPADRGCGTTHQRDDNAAINLARYKDTDTASDSVVGPVGAAVKRGADRKTRIGRAGGREARKGRSHKAAEQPRDGVPVC